MPPNQSNDTAQILCLSFLLKSNFIMQDQGSEIRDQVKCYIINLDRSKDRLKYITHVFNENELIFERVTAIDGVLLSDEEFKLLAKDYVFSRGLSKAEAGCFLSHRECLRRVAEGNNLWGAIFEDDVILSKNIKSILKNSNWIPNDIDILKLDTNQINCILGHPCSVNVTQTSSVSYQIMRLISKHYGAGGYIISRNCARKLYELTKSIRLPIDELYFNPDYGMLRKLNVQQIVPAVVAHQPRNESTIAQQRQYSRRNQKKRSLLTRLAREIERTCKKRILPAVLVLTRGYRYVKVPFE